MSYFEDIRDRLIALTHNTGLLLLPAPPSNKG